MFQLWLRMVRPCPDQPDRFRHLCLTIFPVLALVCPHTIKLFYLDTTHMSRSSLAFQTESHRKLGGVWEWCCLLEGFGGWRHAPPETFKILGALRCILASWPSLVDLSTLSCQRSKFNFSIKFDQDLDQRLSSLYIVTCFPKWRRR